MLFKPIIALHINFSSFCFFNFFLQPTHLEVINESNMHNVPRGSETHFKVVVVSSAFEDLSLIKRHRSVNDVLKSELDGPVHALSIQVIYPMVTCKSLLGW